MITRQSTLPLSKIFTKRITFQSQPGHRRAYAKAPLTRLSIPTPTPFVPDHTTFLSLIGRNLSQHASKIANWQSLFSLTSAQLRELGVEPARTRRYLIWWRERFRKGIFGVGGDLKHVNDGVAELRVVEVPVADPGARMNVKEKLGTKTNVILPAIRKMVVNESPESLEARTTAEQLTPVNGVKTTSSKQIAGPFVRAVKGTKGAVGRIQVQEGMWEVQRGVKMDGGERRQKMVRRQKLLAKRRRRRDKRG